MGDNLLTVLQGEKLNKLESYYQRAQSGELIGLEGSGKNFFLANLYLQLEDDILIVTANDQRADTIYEDLVRLLEPNQVMLFSQLEILPHEPLEIEETIKLERLSALEAAITKEPRVIIAPIQALLEVIMPAQIYQDKVFRIHPGQKLSTDDLISKLRQSGYQRVEQVQTRGQFSIRGGIIDIYSYTINLPVRIELFGDQVESIRQFEVANQRSTSQLDSIMITPATEFIFPSNLKEGIKDIQADLDTRLKELSGEQEEQLKKIIKQDLEFLDEQVDIVEKRQYLSYFYQSATLLDYVSGLIVCDNWLQIKQQAITYLNSIQERYNNLLNQGKVLPSYQDYFVEFNDLFFTDQNPKLYLSPTKKKLEDITSQFDLNLTAQNLESLHGQLDLLVDQLKKYRKQDYQIIIGLSNLKQANRLQKKLQEDNLTAVVIEEIKEQINSNNIILTVSNLSKGFIFPEAKFLFYTTSELFKQAKRQRKRAKNFDQGSKISSFTELNEGNYVVHENHGIGKYLGIKTLEVQGNSEDYLVVKYAGDDKLYIPTDQVDLIGKYVGMDDNEPKLHKLDSDNWAKAKARVKKSVEEMAEDLLELYAKREMATGYAFSKDTEWQVDFEAAFPYQETPDQLKAIEEVKADMESEQPMDRLLCGDVGYGKTEVAIRAMFKAVMDGKQVAFLVPTTILAQQHWNNLIDRFSEYPVNVSMLSRFRTAKEQQKIIEDLEAGRTDIIIGTHRLLSQDIKFNNLGLVVVDEEQRFGVTQKEKLKGIKENIDILTLTATPIPRTLHMSLVGIRDISVIETAPKNRYPIRTYVGEYKDELVKDALVKELNRDGQIYVVHNRVKDIKEVASQMQSLVPQAEIAVAHGQMNEKRLERLMLDFLEGNFDILVSTTIIETGMDIPNVNTIIINQADKMGLAQLYQLRGRVGRSNRIAYAYLLYDQGRILSEIAEKRLKAIKEFTSLGSGFKIAMRDLEIRGAGNILGPEQHGHIEAVGFSLYCKLLETAIKKLQNKEEAERKVKMELKVDAYLPADYIADSKQKIEVYKEIKTISTLEEQTELVNQLQDRFGKLPPAVKRLLKLTKLRILARKLLVEEITEKNDKVKLIFSADCKLEGADFLKLGQQFSGIRVVASKQPKLEVKSKDLEDKQKINLLLDILACLTPNF
ncbi:transcription-repair coupling factor Mfd [Halobacteroides halobius DSM 5150]|uniref:Transcription-repair-coupling factor n=1 Tax=Halobacteroides halobius (strain ATCC 35273 / DSM 5150 / MD-1) TaxID=748449 RepID=L0K7M1_HALHC|nr:transcription-repair coupling factor [Halobacteroides halobius]AGB40123.1 transcription-repair coupling factor Mfd [Halobacteroides halobius DSM 5150]